jgi:hypothetical protein
VYSPKLLYEYQEMLLGMESVILGAGLLAERTASQACQSS